MTPIAAVHSQFYDDDGLDFRFSIFPNISKFSRHITRMWDEHVMIKSLLCANRSGFRVFTRTHKLQEISYTGNTLFYTKH